MVGDDFQKTIIGAILAFTCVALISNFLMSAIIPIIAILVTGITSYRIFTNKDEENLIDVFKDTIAAIYVHIVLFFGQF